MERLAPHIKRQHFLIEGFLKSPVDEETLEDFFDRLISLMKWKRTGHSTLFYSEEGRQHACVPLKCGNLSLTLWEKESFFSLVLFSSHPFDEKRALALTRDFFDLSEDIAKHF